MSSARDKQIANGAEINEGIVRTSVYCHDCNNTFIATVDYDIDGDHMVVCPYCGHKHCRTIEKGVVTNDRWSSQNSNLIMDRAEKLWTDNSLKMKTSSTSHFLREKWLNLGK